MNEEKLLMRKVKYKREDEHHKGLFFTKYAILHNFVIDNGIQKAFVEEDGTHKILLLDVKEITLL